MNRIPTMKLDTLNHSHRIKFIGMFIIRENCVNLQINFNFYQNERRKIIQ